MKDLTAKFGANLHDEVVMLSLKHFGQSQIKSGACLRPRVHGCTETRSACVAAVDRHSEDLACSRFDLYRGSV